MNQYASSAIDRYLKNLKQALGAASKAAKEDALGDAAEFLSNELSSLDVEQRASAEAEPLLTSEQQFYDYFIESYGSPLQVASEYLPLSEAATGTSREATARKYLSIAMVVLLVSTGAFFVARIESPLRRSPSVPVVLEAGKLPPKISPFTRIEFQGDKVLVEFKGSTYEWLGIDDIPVSNVTASSKQQFRGLWRKRITEDLVEVLWGMGHYPARTVKLHLYDTQKNIETNVAAAPMTRANRQSMYGNYVVHAVSP